MNKAEKIAKLLELSPDLGTAEELDKEYTSAQLDELIDAAYPDPGPVEKGSDVFVVADGKAVIGIAGIVNPGDVVTPEMFNGGSATFERLSGLGFFVKK